MTTSLTDLVTRSQKLSPLTKSMYLTAVERFVAFVGRDPSCWSPVTVERFRDHLISTGLKPQSANTHLHGVFYAARRWEAMGLGANWARGAEHARVEAPAKQRTKRQGLVESELGALMEATSGNRPVDLRDRAIIAIGIRCGGRRAVELSTLDWQDIDAHTAIFRVKGGYDLTVPFDGEARAQLRPWRDWFASVYGGQLVGGVFRSLRLRVDGRWQVGERLGRQSVWRVIRDRGEAAGLKRKLHPHLLRHTYIGMAEAAGMLPQDIMRMTGHRSLQTLSGYISKERFTERSLVQLPSFTDDDDEGEH
jgi:integrase/recombinase XerD